MAGKSKLFQYAVIYHPKPTRDAIGNDTTEPSQLLVEPAFELAETEAAVGLKAARAIPDSYADRLSDIDIVIRPF